MNLIQQCKAIMTPRGQVQMSYDRFKNTFGDLGVAAWRGFLMDNNNLPDGTYNGITKKTINKAIGINVQYNFAYFEYSAGPYIPPASNSEVWQYGFANYNVISKDAMEHDVSIPSVCITIAPLIAFKTPGFTTISEYNAYLAKHPIVLYYYDSSVWNGAIVNTSYTAASGNHVFAKFTDIVTSDNRGHEVRDVSGYYKGLPNESYESLYARYEDLTFCLDINTSVQRIVYINKSAETLDEFHTTMPRAIVWKK